MLAGQHRLKGMSTSLEHVMNGSDEGWARRPPGATEKKEEANVCGVEGGAPPRPAQRGYRSTSSVGLLGGPVKASSH